MSEFQASNFKKENGGTPDLLGKTELTSPYFFVPPSGDTASRPQSCAPGTLRFNTDIGTLEVFKGDVLGWAQILRRESQYLGGGTGSNTGTGTRGLMHNPSIVGDSETNLIEFITISTMGAQQDFGDSTVSARQRGGLGNSTRSMACAGTTSAPNKTDTIDFVTVSSTGNATDFGNFHSSATGSPSGISNQTRGIFAGGEVPSQTNIICYVTISQTVNTVDFGDLTAARNTISGGGNSTRGIYCGGNPNSKTNIIDFITMATQGDASDFGDLTVEKRNAGKGQASNATRHIVYGGQITPTVTNSIEFVTIATLGNGIDFGDASTPIESSMAMASSTRAVFAGGNENDDTTHGRIDSLEFATKGEITSFGTLSPSNASGGAGTSNGHGGL